ncbi:hypothetical protein Hanom_Chr09g00855221 [Helianthus anomalus]
MPFGNELVKYNMFPMDGINSSYFTFRRPRNTVPSFNLKNTIFLRFNVVLLGSKSGQTWFKKASFKRA